MHTPKKISVVIPTFNRRDRLVRTLESVYRQTLAPHEIIVVDDGSTDGTREAMTEAGHAGRIRYHRIDHAGRPAVARNRGIRLATGDWVALLDSDDLWKPEKLERQMRFYAELDEAERKSCGLIDTFTLVVDEETESVVTTRTCLKRGVGADRIMTGGYVNQTSSVLIRRAVFEEVGLFDERLWLSEDSEMWLRIAKRFRVFTVGEYLNQYRVNTSSISHNLDRRIEDHFMLMGILQERHADLGSALIARIVSYRRAFLLQKIYGKGTRDLYLRYFRQFFAEDKTIVLRSRTILPCAVLAWLEGLWTKAPGAGEKG